MAHYHQKALQRPKKEEKIPLGSLEPAAIQFMLKRLQQSTRRSGICSHAFVSIDPGS